MVRFLIFSLCTCILPLLIFSSVDAEPRESPSRRPAFGRLAREIIRNNDLAASIGIGRLARLQRSVFDRSKCKVRLCFALDGGNTITKADFELQKDLVNIIASVAAVDGASFSAVQYGVVNSFISLQTSNSTEFRASVDNSEYSNADGSFIGAGLGFCITNVRDGRARDGSAVVLLSDGRGEFKSTFLSTVLRAAEGVKLFAVGVGRKQSFANLRQAVGGRTRNVFSVGRTEDAGEVVVKVIQQICSLS